MIFRNFMYQQKPAYNSLLLVWSTGDDGEHDNQSIQCGMWILKTQRPHFKMCPVFQRQKFKKL